MRTLTAERIFWVQFALIGLIIIFAQFGTPLFLPFFNAVFQSIVLAAFLYILIMLWPYTNYVNGKKKRLIQLNYFGGIIIVLFILLMIISYAYA